MNQNPTTFLLLFVLLLRLSTSTSQTPPPPPSDAVSLLSFKSKSDLNNKLLYTLNEPFDYCQWQGVKCLQGYVIHLLLPSFNLRGILAPDTLSHLYQLRVLSLHNNSLYGPIPDFSSLSNLKSLSLSHNSFSASFPPSLLSLHRLQTLDFSFNNFSGPIPVRILSLDRLLILKLEFNRFNGTVPPLNQPFLFVLNLTGNNLTGKIPVTPTLSRFNSSSFFSNFDLCGEIVNKECKSRDSFFGRDFNQSAPSVQNTESTDVILSPVTHSKRDGNRLVLGFSIAAMVLVAGIVCFYASTRKGTRKSMARDSGIEEKIEFETKVKGIEKNQKSDDNVVFNEEGEGLFSIEELMRASAELLGRGTIGITYKAVLCNRLMVTVKRMDGCKSAATSDQEFERHMEVVCGLRHPNLVPIRAYFQARGERLVVYDYQPNGSLFNLIHGSRSARAKPLHWTSCLKIAEDLAQGIAYIHQASKLIHGNLKSTNVLLGADFEACVTDYCLSVLVDCSEDADSSHYRAPETRKSGHRATHKSDVYAFGVLLLELLTGRHPSQHPFLEPTDVADWVRAVREDDGGESHQLGMLTEVASICSTTSPEQRPTMWQVLKMIHEIKESVMTEDSESSGF